VGPDADVLNVANVTAGSEAGECESDHARGARRASGLGGRFRRLAQLEDDASAARVYEMPSRYLRSKVTQGRAGHARFSTHVSLRDMPDDELQLKHKTLDATSFGARVAEEEADDLGEYFVETDQWKRVYRGDVDVVYGAKGSGKSALYSLLVERGTESFDATS